MYVIPARLNNAVVTAGDVLVGVYCAGQERLGGLHGQYGKTLVVKPTSWKMPRTPSPLKNLRETMSEVTFFLVMMEFVNEFIIDERQTMSINDTGTEPHIFQGP